MMTNPKHVHIYMSASFHYTSYESRSYFFNVFSTSASFSFACVRPYRVFATTKIHFLLVLGVLNSSTVKKFIAYTYLRFSRCTIP